MALYSKGLRNLYYSVNVIVSLGLVVTCVGRYYEKGINDRLILLIILSIIAILLSWNFSLKNLRWRRKLNRISNIDINSRELNSAIIYFAFGRKKQALDKLRLIQLQHPNNEELNLLLKELKR